MLRLWEIYSSDLEGITSLKPVDHNQFCQFLHRRHVSWISSTLGNYAAMAYKKTEGTIFHYSYT